MTFIGLDRPGLGADDSPLRLAGQLLDHLRVQFRRLGVDRRVTKQGRIERAGVGYGILPACESGTIS